MNILLKSTNWVGDAVMQTPAMRALRRGFPEARITLVARPWVAPLFRAHPDIDELVIEPNERSERRAAARKLRERPWDLGVAFPNSLSAALLLWRARARRRIGYARDARRWWLTDPVRPAPWLRHVHETEYHLHLLRGVVETDGIERQLIVTADPEAAKQLDSLLEKEMRETERGTLLAVGAGAAYGTAKRWLPERFAACARALRERHGLIPVLVGSVAEAETARAIAQQIGPPVHDLAGRIDLAQLVALLGRVRLFLTNDSGPMHLAAAQGTPTLAVFGSTNWRTTAPLGPRARVVREPVECAPCLRRHCPIDHRCMEKVTVQRVLEEAEKMLTG